MQPMDDTAFIAQTAQFTSLQQMTQLSQQQALMTSTGYVGRTVTIQNNDGSQITGLVSAIDNSGTDPAVVINGTSYPLTAIKNIGAVGAPAASTPVSTTTPPASSTPTG
jgi:flagellar basal-body rod modification protein FlgD